MQDIFEYDAFLSFASSDEAIAKPIWQEMSLSGLRIFWSDENLKQSIGQSFFAIIQNALSHSRHFVLICTQNSMKSNWVREEYETFFSQCYIPSGRERRLILFHGKDFDRSTLPTLLRNIQMCDSVKEIITTLGGVNISDLINENRSLKKENQIAMDNIQELERELGLSREKNNNLEKKIEFSNEEISNLKRKLSNLRDQYNALAKTPGKIAKGTYTDKVRDKPSTDIEHFNPVVDAKKCNGCEECVEVCPVDVFEMMGDKAVPVNAKECIGCESCTEVCEPNAITIEKT
jgi:ferredoxin